MFHRTELPDGPRVISARLPGSRSVSIAAYVLAGSRLESPADAGVAHFMEHLTFKGTAGYPSSRAISEAVEGVGGSANAATDRESTVYWVRVSNTFGVADSVAATITVVADTSNDDDGAPDPAPQAVDIQATSDDQSGALALTGANIITVVLGGGVLVLAGLLILSATRRRRATE